MPLVSGLIDQSFNDLGVTQPGESVSPTIQAAAFLVLQQMWMSWSNDLGLATAQALAIGTLVSGINQYILGLGGTGGFNVLNPIRVLGWKAEDSSGKLSNGGPILPMAELHALSKNAIGSTSVIPQAVGCDLGDFRIAQNAGSYFQIEVFPRPNASNSLLYLDFIQRLPQFATVADTVFLPEGYDAALHFNLAIALAPQYARVGGVPDALAVNAANSLKFIRDRNAAILGLGQAQPAAAEAQ